MMYNVTNDFIFDYTKTNSLFDIIKDIAKSDKDFVAERIIVDTPINNFICEMHKYNEVIDNFNDEYHEMKLIVEASSNSICIIKKKKSMKRE